MENERQMQEVLEKLEKRNGQQAKYGRVQMILTAAMAAVMVIILIAVLSILPTVMDIAEDAQEIMLQAETVMGNLEQVSAELAEADIASMIENVDGLVTESQANLDATFSKIEELDFETLNLAIDSLAKVIEPLSRFFGVFG